MEGDTERVALPSLVDVTVGVLDIVLDTENVNALDGERECVSRNERLWDCSWVVLSDRLAVAVSMSVAEAVRLCDPDVVTVWEMCWE